MLLDVIFSSIARFAQLPRMTTSTYRMSQNHKMKENTFPLGIRVTKEDLTSTERQLRVVTQGFISPAITSWVGARHDEFLWFTQSSP